MERIVRLLTCGQVIRTGLMFLWVVAFVGCSPSSDSIQAPTPAPTPAPTVASPPEGPGPSGSPSPPAPTGNPELALRPPPAQEAALLVAIDSAVRQCMVGKGFEFNSPDVGQYLQGAMLRVAVAGEEFRLN